VADDGSGAGAAPDEGLLAGGFIARVSNAYELTWAGSGAVRKWYTTTFYSDDFHFYADIKRGSSEAQHGWPGIAFLVKDATNMCIIHLQRESDALVNIVFKRYDTGGDQDPSELEGDVALAYAAWIRIGVRISNGVATAYRATAVTGASEVSLGTLSIGASWIGDDDYNLAGVVQHQSTTAQGVAWDNITLESVGAGTAYTGIIKSERITPFKEQGSGELGLAHFRRVGLRILHTGSFTITVTVWVDGVQTKYYDDSDSNPDNWAWTAQTISFTEAAPTAAHPVEALLEADINAKGTYIEVQISVVSTAVSGVFLPESIEVHARPIKRARALSSAESA